MEKMWYLKIITLQVTAGILGIIKKRINKLIDVILGKPNLYEI